MCIGQILTVKCIEYIYSMAILNITQDHAFHVGNCFHV